MFLATLINETLGSLWPRSTIRPSRIADVQEQELSAAPPDTRRLIRDGRYCRILETNSAAAFDAASIRCAWRALATRMALVPGGEVTLHCDGGTETAGGLEIATLRRDMVCAESTYMDRYCVTNGEFEKFVAAGGYDNPELWPPEVLPNVLQFVDSTGHCGPQHWVGGQPAEDQRDHPVVGVCWYEASAYAIWTGKRLPTTAQWQRAGIWSLREGDGNEPRYPWGNAYDPTKANLWKIGQTGTAPVTAYATGSTPNGVNQLIGNVWEWVDAQFFPESDGDVEVSLSHMMAEIRGGAFDTYFHSQATCQFRSGLPLLQRSRNVGFRCCLATDCLPLPPEVAPNPDPFTP